MTLYLPLSRPRCCRIALVVVIALSAGTAGAQNDDAPVDDPATRLGADATDTAEANAAPVERNEAATGANAQASPEAPATNEAAPATNDVAPATNDVAPATNDAAPATNDAAPPGANATVTDSADAPATNDEVAAPPTLTAGDDANVTRSDARQTSTGAHKSSSVEPPSESVIDTAPERGTAERAAAVDAYRTRMIWNDPGRAQRALYSLHPEYGLFLGQDPTPVPLQAALLRAGRPDVANAAMAKRALILWGETLPASGLLVSGLLALAAANATGIGLFLWSDLSGDTTPPQLPVPLRTTALGVMLGGAVAGMAAVVAGAIWFIVSDALLGEEIEPEVLNSVVSAHNAALADDLGLNPVDDALPSGIVEGEMQDHPLHTCFGLGCMSCRL